MAFGSTADAVEWCMDVQLALMSADWPKELIDHPGAAEEWDEINERYAEHVAHAARTIMGGLI